MAGRGGHRKPHLPEKPCLACGRPFAWRRKWARDWDAVRYCSDACRSGRRDRALAAGGQPLDPAGKRV
ncbi:DUF2256 domain-containing protein [Falsiroseomonas oryziterrae]|uniref:DUF2256 domain-containing protein n=1 Tax=Falsiroseomonas oryziterrae TaxID=2911368 RepID=UPI001F2E0150|nr:DUF2256 domain-containing protein [Roseomonas sp. NPKOSM-4]